MRLLFAAACLLALSVPAAAQELQCRMGTDGRQACGYNCRMGTNGAMACANTPDGVCAAGTDGRAVCTQLAPARRRGARGAPPECKMGTNGRVVCGYACRMGTDGRVVCADTPDGVCQMGTDGRVVCSSLRFRR